MWRIWATTALLLAAAAGNGLAQGGRSAEPSFQGRTLREWMEDLEAPAPLTRHAAVYAIGGMGPRAAPAVPALIPLLRDESAPVRYAAALALGEIGPGAAAAIPELERMVDEETNDDITHIARKSLKRIRSGAPADSAAGR